METSNATAMGWPSIFRGEDADAEPQATKSPPFSLWLCQGGCLFVPGLVNIEKTMERSTIFIHFQWVNQGKSTISMVIFNSYFDKLPEGTPLCSLLKRQIQAPSPDFDFNQDSMPWEKCFLRKKVCKLCFSDLLGCFTSNDM